MQAEMTVPAPLIGPTQVAKRLGISRRHLRTLDIKGLIPRGNKLGCALRFCPVELEQWLAAGSPPRAEWERLKKDLSQ